MTSLIMTVLSLSFLVASIAAQDYTVTFNLPTIIESCGSATIGFAVTPFITQTIPIPLIISVSSLDGTSNSVITRDAILQDGSYFWDPVAVRGGEQYEISLQALSVNGILGLSDPFVVRVGETEDCLTGVTGVPPVHSLPTSAFPSSSTPSTASTSQTSSTTMSRPPSPVTSAASNSTSPFVPTSQLNSSGLSTGAKAGISIAAIVVLIGALVGFYFLLIARRRTRVSRARAVAAVRSGGRGSPTTEWKGLESNDFAYAPTTSNPSVIVSASHAGGGSNTTVPSSMQAVNHGHDALGRSIGSGHPATVSTFSQDNISDEKVYGYPPHDAPGLAYLPAVKRTPSNNTNANARGPMNRSISDASSTSGIGAGAVLPPEVRRSKGPTQRKPVPVYNPSSSTEVDHNRGESSDSFLDPFNVTPIASDDSHVLPLPMPTQDLHRKGSFPNEKPMEHVLSVDPPVQRVGSPPYTAASKHRST